MRFGGIFILSYFHAKNIKQLFYLNERLAWSIKLIAKNTQEQFSVCFVQVHFTCKRLEFVQTHNPTLILVHWIKGLLHFENILSREMRSNKWIRIKRSSHVFWQRLLNLLFIIINNILIISINLCNTWSRRVACCL